MADLEFRQLVERLKLRSPIEVIVGERVEGLRKAGSIYSARCPFHDERTPSFTVDPQRGTWRCWGACSEGGDVISFIERFDGVSFQDALRLLARQAGEELPENLFRRGGGRRGGAESSKSGADEEAAFDVLRRARDLYRRRFLGSEGSAAREYARARGLDDEVLERFHVGWAPREGSPLLEAASAEGVPVDLLEEVGLVKRSESGRPYDFFRGRWMVPIADRLGRTVGFGARVLPQDERGADGRPQAKYVNTRETRLFHKGRLIYALDLAADTVRRSHHLVLVEGYTDVMAAHQAGHTNVAAVLGTSTTRDHAALVRRSGARRVTLVFDGDAAGRKASARALQGLLPLEVSLDVATLPGGADPCDLLVAEGGGERFGALLEEAQEWFAWTLEGLCELDRRGDRAELARAVDEAFALIACLARPVERAMRLRDLASGLGLPEDDVRQQWRRFESGRRPEPSGPTEIPRELVPEAPPAEEPRADPATLQAFEQLLGALLVDNSLIPIYAELAERCPPGDLADLLGALMRLYDDAEDEEPIHAGRLLTALTDHPARHRVVAIEERARLATSAQALARDQELWLEHRRHAREVRELRASLTQAHQSLAGNEGTEDLLKSLHEELKSRRVPGGSEVPRSPHSS